MKERPIIFTHNIPRILDATKTQTRRVVTPKTSVIGEGGDWAKLCWDGCAIHTFPEMGNYTPIKKQEKAPLPFVDDGFWEKDHSAPMYLHVPYNWEDDMTVYRVYCRYDVGDRLWVRETWRTEGVFDNTPPCDISSNALVEYKATPDSVLHPIMGKTRSPLHMPRWASRITLEIREIWVERLKDITASSAIAEGMPDDAPVMRFQAVWDSLNAKRGYPWGSNPFVWVVDFRRV